MNFSKTREFLLGVFNNFLETLHQRILRNFLTDSCRSFFLDAFSESYAIFYISLGALPELLLGSSPRDSFWDCSFLYNSGWLIHREVFEERVTDLADFAWSSENSSGVCVRFTLPRYSLVPILLLELQRGFRSSTRNRK